MKITTPHIIICRNIAAVLLVCVLTFIVGQGVAQASTGLTIQPIKVSLAVVIFLKSMSF
jgi:hypothetical protein